MENRLVADGLQMEGLGFVVSIKQEGTHGNGTVSILTVVSLHKAIHMIKFERQREREGVK